MVAASNEVLDGGGLPVSGKATTVLVRSPESLSVKPRHPSSRICESPLRWASLFCLLSLFSLAAFTAACGIVSPSGDDDTSPFDSDLAPALAKNRAGSALTLRPDAPWSYVLPVDHGVRVTRRAKGHFRAPRVHGEHNGIDLFAPLGTEFFSPCHGHAMAGVSRSWGHWVHLVCPAPSQLTRTSTTRPWISFFFAHLETPTFARSEWTEVDRGARMGFVAKPGHAEDQEGGAHVHVELIVRADRRDAMDEKHLGQDQSDDAAAEHFVRMLAEDCLEPLGFRPKSGEFHRARRIDPFVALSCLSDHKPNFEPAPGPFVDASEDWTHFYFARDFNVNFGVEDAAMASR